MASVTQQGVQSYADEEQGAGWLLFASTMLGLSGILSAIDGIVALARSKFYTANAVYVFSDLRTWGWIMLILGVLLIMAAGGALSGSSWARWFGIFAAGLGAIAQFMVVQAYPLWSLIVFGCCVLVIYALAAYGGKRDMA